MSDTKPDPEKVLRESAGNLMLHALKHREENIGEMVHLIAAMETAMAGLPKVVEAMEEFGGSCRTPPRIDDIEIPDAWNDQIGEKAGKKMFQDLQNILDGHFAMLRVFSNSMRACAKTQITLSKYLKHVATMLLPYMVSDSFAGDCSHAAIKMGKGDEALRAFAQAKFPSVFNKKPTDEH